MKGSATDKQTRLSLSVLQFPPSIGCHAEIKEPHFPKRNSGARASRTAEMGKFSPSGVAAA
jgi:hypothetical protein